MSPKNPVQLREKRIATVFTWDVAPPVLEVETEPEEFAEVIGKVRCDALALQCRVRDRVRAIEAHAGILAPVELPLCENAGSVGTAGITAGAWGNHRIRKHDLAAQQVRLPLSLTERLPAIHEVNGVHARDRRCFGPRMPVAGPSQFGVVCPAYGFEPSQIAEVR